MCIYVSKIQNHFGNHKIFIIYLHYFTLDYVFTLLIIILVLFLLLVLFPYLSIYIRINSFFCYCIIYFYFLFDCILMYYVFAVILMGYLYLLIIILLLIYRMDLMHYAHLFYNKDYWAIKIIIFQYLRLKVRFVSMKWWMVQFIISIFTILQ